MTNTDSLIDQAKDKFNKYLEENKLRKTSERYTILEEIYRRDDHFDAEALYIHMKSNNYRVSRATVYNTLELLQNCGLVKRHQFGKNLALFEKSLGYKQHDHMICTECGKVLEFCDPRVQQIKDMVSSLYKFNVESHSLNLYGTCEQGCAEKKGERA